MSMKTFKKLMRCLAVVLIVASLVPSLACMGRIQQAAQKQKDANELKQVALEYHMYIEDNKKPPATINELISHLQKSGLGSPDLINGLNSGKYVFYMGVEVTKLPDSGHTVLGYESAVPTSGGQVVMADGSVTTMTAAEFNTATKPPNAKPSKP
jgi:hypothetical protein